MALYWIIRGKYGATFSPLQPDSSLYVCRGLKISGLDEKSRSLVLDQVTRIFRGQSSGTISCGELPSHYQSRILLPFLMSIFAHTGIGFLLAFPTLAISLGTILVWWRLTYPLLKNFISIGLCLALAPWMSPHFGGHAFLMLTEGPLLLITLSIVWLGESKFSHNYYWPILTILAALGIINRQSWPILGVVAGYSILRKWKLSSRKLTVLIFSVSTLCAGIFAGILTHERNRSISYSQYDDALSGIIKGIAGDFSHTVKFVDIPGVIVLISMLAIFLIKGAFQEKLASLLLLGVTLYSVGGVYLDDGSYSQNWRYFLINGFLSIYFLIATISGRIAEGHVKVSDTRTE
jgi:hypothetical protein